MEGEREREIINIGKKKKRIEFDHLKMNKNQFVGKK